MSFRSPNVDNFSNNIDPFDCLSIEQISRMEHPSILWCVDFESAYTIDNRINHNKQPHPLEGSTALSRSWKIWCTCSLPEYCGVTFSECCDP